jgi:hypothetical protein
LWSYYSLREVENELAREHLKLLRTTLSKRPDSKTLLRKLDAWLKVKGRGETCFKGETQAEKQKGKSGSTGTSFAGDTR